MKGPGYTVKDLVYYTGMFSGIILVFAAAKPYGIQPIFCFIGGLIVGAGLGWMAEQIYEKNWTNDQDQF